MKNKKNILGLSDFTKEVEKLNLDTNIVDEGKIIELSDGVAWVDGLDSVMYGEVVSFNKDVKGLVFNLEIDRVGVIVLGNYERLKKINAKVEA